MWSRVRRRAVERKVRPLRLHCARRSWATRALQAGKNIRWVADQLGHADPSLTLRVYAHAMPSDETDLSFAEFDVSGRLYPSPTEEDDSLDASKYAEGMARREGWLAPLRVAAVPPGSEVRGGFGSFEAWEMARREGLLAPLRAAAVPPGSEAREGFGSFEAWKVARREGFEPPTLRFEA